jgi:callose synthase
MAKQLHEMIDENYFQPPPVFEEEGSFLKNVIEPIFNVLQKVSLQNSRNNLDHPLLKKYFTYKFLFFSTSKEAQKSKGGTAGHSAWRNYDDLNEIFW